MREQLRVDITQKPLGGAGAAPVPTPGFVLASAADNVRKPGFVSKTSPSNRSVLAAPRACDPIVLKWPGEWFGPVPIARAARGIQMFRV